MTEDKMKQRYCPIAMAGNPKRCFGSECVAFTKGRQKIFVTHGDKPEEEWGWDPSKHDRDYNPDDANSEMKKVKKIRYEYEYYCKIIGE